MTGVTVTLHGRHALGSALIGGPLFAILAVVMDWPVIGAAVLGLWCVVSICTGLTLLFRAIE